MVETHGQWTIISYLWDWSQTIEYDLLKATECEQCYNYLFLSITSAQSHIHTRALIHLHIQLLVFCNFIMTISFAKQKSYNTLQWISDFNYTENCYN